MLTRRLFVSLLGLSPLAIVCNVSSIKASSNSNLPSEILEAISAWKQYNVLTPDEFITVNGINTEDLLERKKIISDDFKLGNTIEVHGMILSKAELAYVLSAITKHISE